MDRRCTGLELGRYTSRHLTDERTGQQALQKENELNFLLGHFPQLLIRAPDFSGFDWYPAAGLPADWLENRPDMHEAEQLVQATNLEVGTVGSAPPDSSVGFIIFKKTDFL